MQWLEGRGGAKRQLMCALFDSASLLAVLTGLDLQFYLPGVAAHEKTAIRRPSNTHTEQQEK